MRTEQEVINQILSYAVSVSDIQVVIRTNLVPVRKYLYSYEFYFIVENIEDFEGCCGEFYWVLKTYAEYVLRKEIPAAMFYLNLSVRDVVNRMIRWYICLQNGKSVELGILDSYMENFLSGDMWACYCETYACAEETSMWKALDAMVLVFHMAGEKVATWIDTVFPEKQEQDMREFLNRLKCSGRNFSN